MILLEAITVDADGNMLTRTNQQTNEVTTYQWDDFDRLLSVSSSISGRKQDNRYHTEGLRKRKLDVNDNVSNEYSAAISTAASNAAAPGSTSPTISYIMGHQILGCEVNGNFRFHLMDAQGSVRDVVDDTGAVIRSMEFQEHGQLLNSSGSGTISPKTYQGGLSVNDDTADSGLYLMGHRHFDSSIGRFISRDPIGFAGSLNLFGTHSVSPVMSVDPEGLNPLAIGALIVGGVGSAIYLNEAKKYAQQKARDLISRNLEDRIYGGPPDRNAKNPKPRDGSYQCEVLYDKYKHCVVSCQTALKFGGATAWAIGFGHESRGIPSGKYDSLDMLANQTGIGFAGSAGVKSDADCETNCESKYQKSYTWRGDKTVLPSETIIPAPPTLKVPPVHNRPPSSYRGEQF